MELAARFSHFPYSDSHHTQKQTPCKATVKRQQEIKLTCSFWGRKGSEIKWEGRTRWEEWAQSCSEQQDASSHPAGKVLAGYLVAAARTCASRRTGLAGLAGSSTAGEELWQAEEKSQRTTSTPRLLEKRVTLFMSNHSSKPCRAWCLKRCLSSFMQ